NSHRQGDREGFAQTTVRGFDSCSATANGHPRCIAQQQANYNRQSGKRNTQREEQLHAMSHNANGTSHDGADGKAEGQNDAGQCYTAAAAKPARPGGAGTDNQADAGANNKPAQQDEQSLVEE